MTYQDYENELLQNINHYTVTQHLGRGQYNKIDCTDLEHANKIKQQILDEMLLHELPSMLFATQKQDLL